MVMHDVNPVELLQRAGDAGGIGELAETLVGTPEITPPGTGREDDRIWLRALGGQDRYTMSCLSERVTEQPDDEFDPPVAVWRDRIPGWCHKDHVAFHRRTKMV